MLVAGLSPSQRVPCVASGHATGHHAHEVESADFGLQPRGRRYCSVAGPRIYPWVPGLWPRGAFRPRWTARSRPPRPTGGRPVGESGTRPEATACTSRHSVAAPIPQSNRARRRDRFRIRTRRTYRAATGSRKDCRRCREVTSGGRSEERTKPSQHDQVARIGAVAPPGVCGISSRRSG